MKTILTHTCLLITGFAMGATISLVMAAEQVNPAYLIVSAERIDGITGADYAPYRAAAGPLAAAAGLEMTAPAQQPTLLEGQWPYAGTVAIERFTSMQALQDFWYSDDYQAAKELREGLSNINFIVAVQGN